LSVSYYEIERCKYLVFYIYNESKKGSIKMINQEEKEIIIHYAKKFGVSSIYLFGSSLTENEYNDIDLAVEGIEPELFFKFYGKLLRNLSKPIDLIDLAEKTHFTKLIQKEAVKIYE